jgi:succinate dehydrogenase/fumarate reductase flavoprotein subunit
LRRLRGVQHFLRLPWILFLMKTHRIRSVRQAVLGIDPAHRERGLAALMCYDNVLRSRKQGDWAELSWIESNNKEVIAVIEAMGGVWSKTYHLYQRSLQPHSQS